VHVQRKSVHGANAFVVLRQVFGENDFVHDLIQNTMCEYFPHIVIRLILLCHYTRRITGCTFELTFFSNRGLKTENSVGILFTNLFLCNQHR
jgi:hypothetical protein